MRISGELWSVRNICWKYCSSVQAARPAQTPKPAAQELLQLTCLVRRAKPVTLAPAPAFMLWDGFIFFCSIWAAVIPHFLHCLAPKNKQSSMTPTLQPMTYSFPFKHLQVPSSSQFSSALGGPNLVSVLSPWLKPCFPVVRTASPFPSPLPMILLLEKLWYDWLRWSCLFLVKQPSQDFFSLACSKPDLQWDAEKSL